MAATSMIQFCFSLIVAFCIFVSVRTFKKVLGLTGDVFWLRLAYGLLFWLTLVSIGAIAGIFSDFQALPPRLLLAVVPGLAFCLFLGFSHTGEQLAESLSLRGLTLVQSFRIFVEMVLYALVQLKAMPEVMTFTGRNFDVLVGVSAPLVAFLFAERKAARGVMIAWNILGIGILGVTVFHGIMSAPTPFRMFFGDVPNSIVGYFPFILLPAFLVPFAFSCHVISLRKLMRHA